jgi:hypothetical protein
MIEQPSCYVVNNIDTVARMFLQIAADLARLDKGNEVELLELCAVTDLNVLLNFLLVTDNFAPMDAKLVSNSKCPQFG